MNHLFQALSDPTRRKILDMLKKKDLTAGEIADAFSISKPQNWTNCSNGFIGWEEKRKNKSSIKIVSYETTQQEERSSYMAYSFIAIHLCFYCLEQTSRPGANALQCKR